MPVARGGRLAFFQYQQLLGPKIWWFQKKVVYLSPKLV